MTLRGPFKEGDTDSIVAAILNLTGGERRPAKVLADVCKLKPTVFRGQTSEQDEAKFREVLERVGHVQLPEQIDRSYWREGNPGAPVLDKLEMQLADLPGQRKKL